MDLNICVKDSDTLRVINERGFLIFASVEALDFYFKSPSVTNDGQPKNKKDSSMEELIPIIIN